MPTSSAQINRLEKESILNHERIGNVREDIAEVKLQMATKENIRELIDQIKRLSQRIESIENLKNWALTTILGFLLIGILGAVVNFRI